MKKHARTERLKVGPSHSANSGPVVQQHNKAGVELTPAGNQAEMQIEV